MINLGDLRVFAENFPFPSSSSRSSSCLLLVVRIWIYARRVDCTTVTDFLFLPSIKCPKSYGIRTGGKRKKQVTRWVYGIPRWTGRVVNSKERTQDKNWSVDLPGPPASGSEWNKIQEFEFNAGQDFAYNLTETASVNVSPRIYFTECDVLRSSLQFSSSCSRDSA